MKRTLFFLLTFLFVLPLGFAQETPEYLQIAGKVIDGSSGKPLHYASVNLAGTTISNVTNADGVFSLKIDPRTAPSALVTVSYLGYATVTLKLSDFQGFDIENPRKVMLTQVSLTLNPALIRAENPEELLMAAIYKIKQNYPDQHVGLTAFYREMVKKGNSKYLTMNEAILDIDKAPYSSYQVDRVGIYKGRGSQNYDSTDTLFIRYQGGVVSILDIDQAKHPFAIVAPYDVPRFYDLHSEPAEFLGERMFYVVSFNQKPGVEEIYLRGKVYIDSESLAIGRMEMWMNVEGRDDAVELFVLKRPQSTQFEVKSAGYVINYKCIGDKWYYDYGKMELKFETRRKRSLFRNHYTVVSEIAVTDHKPEPPVIERDARVRFKDQMTEKVSAFTDANFWENYNVIEPDADIEAIIRKIVRQLKKHNLE
ncbi:MAG: carboxypeptidase-like regulatory domain-containing protein [Bacteroidales bacterium]|nr:carboxypeptidase-like regulatory domain-containing protein [Bacteroidales bacterium]